MNSFNGSSILLIAVLIALVILIGPRTRQIRRTLADLSEFEEQRIDS